MKNLFTLLVIVSLLPGCKKLIENEEEKKNPWHFSASINDKDVKYQANDNGSDIINTGWSSWIAFGSNNEHTAIQGTIFFDATDEDHNILRFGAAKYFDHTPAMAEQVAMFHTGNYTFGNRGGSTPAIIDGVFLEYVDSNGKKWLSENGSQTGSSFNITEIEDVSGIADAKNIRAIFNCKLYDDQGNMIPVSNAEFHGKLFYQ